VRVTVVDVERVVLERVRKRTETLVPTIILPTRPTLNIDLLRDLVDWVWGDHTKFKEHWNQGVYMRRTPIKRSLFRRRNTYQNQCCVAGMAVLTTGKEFMWHSNYSLRTNEGPIYGLAQKTLGLTWSEAANLFDGNNTRADIDLIAKSIAERRGMTLYEDVAG